MRFWPVPLLVFCQLCAFAILWPSTAHAQNAIAVKSGETVELNNVYWVMKCRSVMIGLPVIEVLEGPPDIALTIKEAMVLPRQSGCAKPVPGGKLMLAAGTIAEKKESKLVYRLLYKLKDGDRQTAKTYQILLYP
jgi:hypothetical protein